MSDLSDAFFLHVFITQRLASPAAEGRLARSAATMESGKVKESNEAEVLGNNWGEEGNWEGGCGVRGGDVDQGGVSLIC